MFGEGFLPVEPEEVFVESRGDVIPRENFVVVTMASGEPLRVEALGIAGIEPTLQYEVL